MYKEHEYQKTVITGPQWLIMARVCKSMTLSDECGNLANAEMLTTTLTAYEWQNITRRK